MLGRARFFALLVWAALACGEDPVAKPKKPGVDRGGSSGIGGTASGGTAGTAPTDGGEAGQPEPPGPPCNTWPALCEKTYDTVSYPVTHAAMANSALWDFPAQRQRLRTQLDESIRGLWLEVREHEAEPALCFHDCAEGRASLAAELADVRAFFEANPREVVTLLIENHIAAPDIEQALGDAGLTPYLFTGDAPPWPTLGEMIDDGTRLVVFLSDTDGAGEGYRDFGAFARTSATAGEVSELSCDLEHGSADDEFLLTPQLLIGPSGANGEGGAASLGRPNAELAETVNHDPELSERLSLCTRFWGRKPNFVAVDFYDTSDVVGATQRLDALIP